MSNTDKIVATFTVAGLIIFVALFSLLIFRTEAGRYKPDEYRFCIDATHNKEGCEKEVYPERHKERQEKESFYRRHVPTIE